MRRYRVERAVGDEGFAAGLSKQDDAAVEQPAYLVAAFGRHEDNLALACAPLANEVCGFEEDVFGFGEG